MTKSNTPYRKICHYCHKEFEAHTRTTKYCSHKCNQRAYKQAKRDKAHAESQTEGLLNSEVIKTNLLLDEIATSVKGIEKQLQLTMRPYLSIKEVGELLDLSRASVYRMVQSGILPSYSLSERKLYIKRSDIDLLFETPNNKTT